MFSRLFRSTATLLPRQAPSSRMFKLATASSLLVGSSLVCSVSAAEVIDYNEVRKTIASILEQEGHDDGSLGPVLVRLAWHASGTYSKYSNDGGSDGATMRFDPESGHGANAGLHLARNALDKVKAKYPGLSYADLWTLAGVVAIEEMGGPKIAWRPGRRDVVDASTCPPDGRLPDAAKGPDHIRAIFYKMGFNDQEIVALLGAHALGRCHTDRSGFEGPWTRAPTTFSNEFFRVLLEEKWTWRNWGGPKQYQNEAKDLMMLPADYALVEDPDFKKWVVIYANDEKRFFVDFANAFQKLEELGVKQFDDTRKTTPLVAFGLVAALAAAASKK